MSSDQYYQRLSKHLPALLTPQNKESILGALLDLIAEQLHGLDQSMRRVLYDRWVALATGAIPNNAVGEVSTSALDRLGALLQVYRLPSRLTHLSSIEDKQGLTVYFRSSKELTESLSILVGYPSKNLNQGLQQYYAEWLENLFVGLKFKFPDKNEDQKNFRVNTDNNYNPDILEKFKALLKPEPSELFRERLQITALLLHQGTGTPRAILSRALANLGVWPCPNIKYPDLIDNKDTTIAWGMPLEYRTQCTNCTNNTFINHHSCRHNAVITAWLTDNPIHPIKESKPLLKLSEAFTLKSDSLWEDRPSIKIKVVGGGVKSLSMKSRRSGEQLTINQELKKGDELFIYPFMSQEELGYFETYEEIQHHQWLKDYPEGKTELKTNGNVKRLSKDDHHYTTGSVFFEYGKNIDPIYCRFGETDSTQGLRFGSDERIIRPPKLLPGDNIWLLSWQDVTPSNKSTTEEQSELRVSLELHWFTRPPFNFRLTIPKKHHRHNHYMDAALQRGALQLVHDDLKRYRTAGIRAELVFPESLDDIEHQFNEPTLSLHINLYLISDAWESISPHEDTPKFSMNLLLKDEYNLERQEVLLAGMYDLTHIDFMLLA